jgi:hypothetical protein
MCEGVKEQEQNENLGSFDFSRIIRQTAVREPQIGEEEDPMSQPHPLGPPPSPFVMPAPSRVDYTDINGGKKSRRRRSTRRRSTRQRSTRQRSTRRHSTRRSVNRRRRRSSRR